MLPVVEGRQVAKGNGICRSDFTKGRIIIMTKLFEITQSRELRVDREAGVIRGVRILGPISANGRRYLPEAVSGAATMYEGRVVNLNHPCRDDPMGDRSINDRFGWLENVQVVDGGLSGDLLYLKSHPQAEAIAEAAERNPRLFGLSHNAEGKTSRKNGTTIVEEITSVRSVDIVSDPASTKSLFESQTREDQTMTKTIKQICESTKSKSKWAKGLKRLMEQDDMAAIAAEPMEMEPEADPNEEIQAAFKKAATAIIQKVFDGEIDESEAFKKLKELLGMSEKATGDEEAAVEPAAAEVAAESLKLVKALGKKIDRLSEAMSERPKGGISENRNSNGNDDYKPPADAKEFLSRVR
jgi:hypothetical protein